MRRSRRPAERPGLATGLAVDSHAIFFPIMAFVALGFDHVVANMFFLPAAVFAGVGGLVWANVGNNLVFALLGNLVGAVVFVAGAYWYLYGREPGPATEKTRAPRPEVTAPERAPVITGARGATQAGGPAAR